MKVPLIVEVAADPLTHERGLSHRTDLPPGLDGMLFIFDRPRVLAFWNQRTFVPLDIAFIDAQRRVTVVLPMRTIVESGGVVESYAPPSPFTAAIEIRRGYLAACGISAGAVVDRELGWTPYPDRVVLTVMT